MSFFSKALLQDSFHWTHHYPDHPASILLLLLNRLMRMWPAYPQFAQQMKEECKDEGKRCVANLRNDKRCKQQLCNEVIALCNKIDNHSARLDRLEAAIDNGRGGIFVAGHTPHLIAPPVTPPAVTTIPVLATAPPLAAVAGCNFSCSPSACSASYLAPPPPPTMNHQQPQQQTNVLAQLQFISTRLNILTNFLEDLHASSGVRR